MINLKRILQSEEMLRRKHLATQEAEGVTESKLSPLDADPSFAGACSARDVRKPSCPASYLSDGFAAVTRVGRRA